MPKDLYINYVQMDSKKPEVQVKTLLLSLQSFYQNILCLVSYFRSFVWDAIWLSLGFVGPCRKVTVKNVSIIKSDKK